MTKETLEEYINKNFSIRKIAKVEKISRSTVSSFLEKFNLKTNTQTRILKESKYNHLDWIKIQEFHDKGDSQRILIKKFSLNKRILRWGIVHNFFKPRSHKEAMKNASEYNRLLGGNWTPELREKARQRMIKRINEDINNHPNKKLAGNRNKMTFPEKLVFDYLTLLNIKFKNNKFIKPYWVDFLIGESLVIEVDGERWHNKEKDKIRDITLTNSGYRVVRYKAKDILKYKNNLGDLIKL